MSISRRHKKHSASGIFLFTTAIAYTALIVYGTLYPFTGWEWPHGVRRSDLMLNWPTRVARPDIITNLLIYVPLGILYGLILVRRISHLLTLFIVFSAGLLTSAALEYLQIFLPGRITSPSDITFNALGSSLGGLIAVLIHPGTTAYRHLYIWRHTYFNRAETTNLGIVVLIIWVVAQLFPFIPSLDPAVISASLKPTMQAIQDPSSLNLLRTGAYGFNTLALCMIYLTTRPRHQPRLLLFCLLVYLIVLLKLPTINRLLPLEALIGTLAGLLAFAVLRSQQQLTTTFAASALIIAYLLGGLNGESYSSTVEQEFNWTLFRGHLGRVSGLVDIIETLWPFTALAYLSLYHRPAGTPTQAIKGGILVFIAALSIEGLQQFIPGSKPDVTDALVAIGGWSLAWYYYLATRRSGQTNTFTQIFRLDAPRPYRADGE